jgi:hypothetical protein
MERSLHQALAVAKYLIFMVGSVGASGQEKDRCVDSGFFFGKGLVGGFM